MTYIDEESPVFQNPSLIERVLRSYDLGRSPRSHTCEDYLPRRKERRRGISPGTVVLFPNREADIGLVDEPSCTSPEGGTSRELTPDITASMEGEPVEDTPAKSPTQLHRSGQNEARLTTFIDKEASHAQAAAAAAVELGAEDSRVDSAQDHSSNHSDGHGASRSKSPLKLQTVSPESNDASSRSPVLRRLPFQLLEPGNVEAPPSAPPPAQRLPSFSQTFPGFPQLSDNAQRNDIVDAAVIYDLRGLPPLHHHQNHHHAESFSSAASPSPRLPLPFANSVQTSPVSHYGSFSAMSPTSTTSDSHHYGSPKQYRTADYYAQRRSSAPVDQPLHPPPSLPSNSSSGESLGPPGSTADGYSTSRTTPIEVQPLQDGNPIHPQPPPPLGMPSSAVISPGGYKCDFPGCSEEKSFQTQYLLTSHQNVHSQVRTHFCPVQGCRHSEGGKGFKRKNEMIRHGLVHSSPGYICPFCPEREHKYPRPDNLQRHVRAHHVDKDKNDPVLREVLASGAEGSGKSRRRRANTGGSREE